MYTPATTSTTSFTDSTTCVAPLLRPWRSRYWPTLIFCCVTLSMGALVILTALPDPSHHFVSKWYITPIAVLAAGFANATAVGGGFLFVPLFTFAFGMPAVTSLKLSLATQAFGMTSGAIGWSRKCIAWKPLAFSCLGSFPGMLVGSLLLSSLTWDVKLMFGWVSLFIGLAVLIETIYGNQQTATEIRNDSFRKQCVFLTLCFFGGLINAWTSIGIGEVVALYLLFVYRLRIDKAIATGVAALAADSVLGLQIHSLLGGIPWTFLAFTAPGVLIGGRYGAKIGHWVESKVQSDVADHSPLKWIFSAVVLMDGIAVLLQAHA